MKTKIRKMKINTTLLAVLLGIAVTTQLRADLLNPTNFTSLGTFDVTNGGYVIDTDALTISETNATSTNTLFTGVLDDQGGQADSFGAGGAVTNVGPLGIPHVAVFTFDDLVMDGTATFAVTGHRALALLSRSNALINVSLTLDGQTGTFTNFLGFTTTNSFHVVGGTGDVGGFPGGDMIFEAPSGGNQGTGLPQAGVGPGGGPGGYRYYFSPATAAAGSFGSFGSPNTTNATGPVYGDLTDTLQGGSGGGCACYNDGSGFQSFYYATGSGGGGALEIDAAGLLEIGPAAILQANGAVGNNTYSLWVIPGGGSGGGIRLAGSQLLLDGSVAADSFGDGGGGRILLRGLTGQHFTTDLGTIDLNHLSVRSLAGSNVLQGVIHIEPVLGDVLAGDSYELGTVVSQAATTNRPAVELKLRDIVAEGTVTVPAGGITYSNNIELSGPVAQITGADPLTLSAQLSGNGTVAVPLTLPPGGSILVSSGNELTFTQPVTNAASISDVGGTLAFPGNGPGSDGLLNHGTLNLIGAVVNGDVNSPAGSAINVAGGAAFNGLVQGAVGFFEDQVTFNGGYSPGDGPGQIQFGGNVTLGSGNTLTMELGGINAGSQYDQLVIGGTATFGGSLNVVLINGFTPAAGQVFQLFNAAHPAGAFTTVNLPALGAGLAWDNQIATNGSIAVVAAPGGRPRFGLVNRIGDNLVFNGTGGTTNGSYVVLSSTNVAVPLTDWIPVSTNPFDANGNFLFTNPIDPGRPQEFYRLKLQ